MDIPACHTPQIQVNPDGSRQFAPRHSGLLIEDPFELGQLKNPTYLGMERLCYEFQRASNILSEDAMDETAVSRCFKPYVGIESREAEKDQNAADAGILTAGMGANGLGGGTNAHGNHDGAGPAQRENSPVRKVDDELIAERMKDLNRQLADKSAAERGKLGSAGGGKDGSRSRGRSAESGEVSSMGGGGVSRGGSPLGKNAAADAGRTTPVNNVVPGGNNKESSRKNSLGNTVPKTKEEQIAQLESVHALLQQAELAAKAEEESDAADVSRGQSAKKTLLPATFSSESSTGLSFTNSFPLPGLPSPVHPPSRLPSPTAAKNLEQNEEAPQEPHGGVEEPPQEPHDEHEQEQSPIFQPGTVVTDTLLEDDPSSNTTSSSSGGPPPGLGSPLPGRLVVAPERLAVAPTVVAIEGEHQNALPSLESSIDSSIDSIREENDEEQRAETSSAKAELGGRKLGGKEEDRLDGRREDEDSDLEDGVPPPDLLPVSISSQEKDLLDLLGGCQQHQHPSSDTAQAAAQQARAMEDSSPASDVVRKRPREELGDGSGQGPPPDIPDASGHYPSFASIPGMENLAGLEGFPPAMGGMDALIALRQAEILGAVARNPYLDGVTSEEERDECGGSTTSEEEVEEEAHVGENDDHQTSSAGDCSEEGQLERPGSFTMTVDASVGGTLHHSAETHMQPGGGLREDSLYRGAERSTPSSPSGEHSVVSPRCPKKLPSAERGTTSERVSVVSVVQGTTSEPRVSVVQGGTASERVSVVSSTTNAASPFFVHHSQKTPPRRTKNSPRHHGKNNQHASHASPPHHHNPASPYLLPGSKMAPQKGPYMVPSPNGSYMVGPHPGGYIMGGPGHPKGGGPRTISPQPPASMGPISPAALANLAAHQAAAHQAGLVAGTLAARQLQQMSAATGQQMSPQLVQQKGAAMQQAMQQQQYWQQHAAIQQQQQLEPRERASLDQMLASSAAAAAHHAGGHHTGHQHAGHQHAAQAMGGHPHTTGQQQGSYMPAGMSPHRGLHHSSQGGGGKPSGVGRRSRADVPEEQSRRSRADVVEEQFFMGGGAGGQGPQPGAQQQQQRTPRSSNAFSSGGEEPTPSSGGREGTTPGGSRSGRWPIQRKSTYDAFNATGGRASDSSERPSVGGERPSVGGTVERPSVASLNESTTPTFKGRGAQDAAGESRGSTVRGTTGGARGAGASGNKPAGQPLQFQ